MIKLIQNAIHTYATREDPFAQPFTLAFEQALHKLFIRRSKVVPYYPRTIAIDATTLCNLRCDMCAIYTLPKSRLGHMPFDDFTKILNQFPSHQMRGLYMMGQGEPLLNTDSIKMLSYAKKKGFVTGLFTNGTLINHKNVKALVKSVNWIVFSVDGATKNTYESIRKGAVFENVINNIWSFINTGRLLNLHPKLGMNFVVVEKNYSEIIDFVELAHRLHIDSVQLCGCVRMIPFNDKGQYQLKISALRNVDQKEMHRQITLAMALCRKYNIEFSLNPLELRWPKCTWPWTGCCISHEGFVTPCCFEPNPQRVNFGNVLEEPFEKIWNNHEYQGFRARLMSDKPPNVCRNCGT